MNILFFVIIMVIILLIILYSPSFLTNIPNIEIVVARYNEKLSWIKDTPFNKYPIIVYNKGPNEDFIKTPKIKKIVTIPNVGRESHTYLYHIVNNYDSLAKITCFFPGSTDTDHKLIKAKTVLDEIENNNKKTVLTCKNNNLIEEDIESFMLNGYIGTHGENKKVNETSDMLLSKIRPLGEWKKHHFGDITLSCITYNLIFSVSKEDILKKPKEYYENLLKEVDSHSNPETGHYFERSMEAVFHPLSHDSFVYMD